MIRAALDTNQYVSMAIKPGGTADRLLAAWRDERFILLVSPAILEEIIRVLRYPRLRRLIRLTPAELDGLMESLLLADIYNNHSLDRSVPGKTKNAAPTRVAGQAGARHPKKRYPDCRGPRQRR